MADRDRQESTDLPGLVPGQSVGPGPRFPGLPRWVKVPNVPDTTLPDIPEYECRRVRMAPPIDGRVDGEPWFRAAWSPAFGRIDDGSEAQPSTRVALLWDDEHLYAAWRIEDPDVRGTTGVHHEQVYVKDDDVELFVEGDGGYYELGINPINTVYEWRWTWVEPLVDRGDKARLNELFMVSDFVYYAARPGEPLGRVGEMDFDLPGLRHAVRVQGTLNHPEDVDEGWTVTVALPWAGLKAVSTDGRGFPPKPGDVLRIQSYRAYHDRSVEGRLADDGSTLLTPYEGRTWSTMGNHNVHNPERWVRVRFTDEPL
jgi:hypothetical protein